MTAGIELSISACDTCANFQRRLQREPMIPHSILTIGVREGILLGGRKKFVLKITICPKNKQYAPKLPFYFNPSWA